VFQRGGQVPYIYPTPILLWKVSSRHFLLFPKSDYLSYSNVSNGEWQSVRGKFMAYQVSTHNLIKLSGWCQAAKVPILNAKKTLTENVPRVLSSTPASPLAFCFWLSAKNYFLLGKRGKIWQNMWPQAFSTFHSRERNPWSEHQENLIISCSWSCLWKLVPIFCFQFKPFLTQCSFKRSHFILKWLLNSSLIINSTWIPTGVTCMYLATFICQETSRIKTHL
jgi:hypothetical protein